MGRTSSIGACRTHGETKNKDVFVCLVLPAATPVLQKLSGDDFSVFRPTGATRCSDYRDIWHSI